MGLHAGPIFRTRIDLKRHLGIEVADPVAYETGDYIVYRWPVPVLVRHFTRISYIKPGRHTPVAHLVTQSIAVRKEMGLGSVVIIGSTLGSLLLAEMSKRTKYLHACLPQMKSVSGGSPTLTSVRKDEHEEVDWRQYDSEKLGSQPGFRPHQEGHL